MVSHHYLTILARILGVQRVQWVLGGLEALHLVLLLHHGHEKASHQLDTALFQFVRLGPILILVSDFLVGHRQTPHCQNAIDIVSNPRMMVRRTGWK